MTNTFSGFKFFLLIGVMYSLQSVLGAVTFQGMPAVLRQVGVEPATIGLIYLLMLPWALKFLWAAPFERWRNHRSTLTKRVFVLANLLAITVLTLLALFDPREQIWVIFGLLGLVALLCASVDISLDGYAINSSTRAQRGWINVMQIGGGYLGAILGGGVFLILVAQFDWRYSLWMIASILLLLLGFVAFSALQKERQQNIASSPKLTLALGNRRLLLGLVVVLLAQFGLRLAQGMAMPFFVDKGVSLTQLGTLATFGGTLVSLVTVVLAGMWIRKHGAWCVLLLLIALQLFIYLGFYFSSTLIVLNFAQASILLLTSSGCAAASFVALYTLMMDWSAGTQAGVDFTLLQCMDTIVALVAGVLSGILVQYLGYGFYFLMAALLSALALCMLPVLKGHRWLLLEVEHV